MKLSPQPHAPLAFGFSNTKPAAKSSSTQSIVLPMLLFTYFGDHDSSQVRGIGFTWQKARANINRDYHLVIERIARAE